MLNVLKKEGLLQVIKSPGHGIFRNAFSRLQVAELMSYGIQSSTSWRLVLLAFLVTSPAMSAETNIPDSIQKGVQVSMEEETTRDRENDASEDPLVPPQSKKVDKPSLQTSLPDILNVYGSLRYRYRDTMTDSFFSDGSSRVGLNSRFQFHENYWPLGRVESGFRLFDNLDQLLDSGSRSSKTFNDDLFLRLGYAGIEMPRAVLTYGKNWSTYYQVASFTDRFQGTGASASGTFNAGTDGGSSGTGRADRVLQSRIQINPSQGMLSLYKPFTLNIQYQDGEKIPHSENIDYDYSLGVSIILERVENMKAGIAFNYAAIKNEDLPSLRQLGINGDDTALLLGLQWFGTKWYAATTLAWMNNHMTTGNGVYFNGWGSEGYGHYNFVGHWWLVGGWNYLEPYGGNDQAGEYIVHYAVLGLRYTFKNFNRLLYANIRLDKSRVNSSDDMGLGNVYTIGLRWDFDWRML